MDLKGYREDAMLAFCSEMAKEAGILTSAVYGRVRWLNESNESATVESVKEGFPYLTVNQVKNSLRWLEKRGYVVSSKPNMDRLDHTKHYAAVS